MNTLRLLTVIMLAWPGLAAANSTDPMGIGGLIVRTQTGFAVVRESDGRPALLVARDNRGYWRVQTHLTEQAARHLMGRADVALVVPASGPAGILRELEDSAARMKAELDELLLSEGGEALLSQITLGSLILQSDRSALWTAADFERVLNPDSALAAQWKVLSDGDSELAGRIRALLTRLARDGMQTQ
jgi:hypothetical protein